MGIELFEHNRTAYVSAAAMLLKTGKSAAIHFMECACHLFSIKILQPWSTLSEVRQDLTIMPICLSSNYILLSASEAAQDGFELSNVDYEKINKLISSAADAGEK